LADENQTFLINEIYKKKIGVIIHQHSYDPIHELIVAIKDKINCRVFTAEHNTPDAQIKMYSNSLLENKYINNWKFNLQKLFYPLFIAKCRFRERRRHRYLYRHSDRYILLSERFVSVFKQVTNLKDCQKLAWIPNPISLPALEESVLMKKEKIILYVGRIDKSHKRVDRLISIFEKLYKDFPDWKLIIVGDGPFRNELERYVNNKGIERVFFEGFQSNVVDYYKKASILCLTSNIEGWGMVLVEAMQYGVIPFSFDSYKSVHDIIDDNKNGFIIPSFDEEKYIHQLKLTMSDSKLRENLSSNAKTKVVKFCDKNIIAKWIELINQ